MDIKSPSSEPSKSYEKANTEKNKTEKAEKQEVVQKPNDKPKPKNKIERPKIDVKKETKNKIQREKIDIDAPTRNKIERPKIDLQKEPRNKIQREKIDLDTPTRNKIELPKIDLYKEPRNIIQREKIDLDSPVRNKIERIPTTEPKISAKPEGNQLSLEQIKEEIKKLDWKSISENWNITNNPNRYVINGKIVLDPTRDPSRQNPLYRHKSWLKTVYNNPDWNLNGIKLGKICSVDSRTIGRWQKILNIPIKSQYAQQKLFFDGRSKECGRCHEIQPSTNFTFRRKNEVLYPKSTCKKCDDKQKQIFALKNKVKVIKNLYKGKLGTRCPECNTGPERLPALEFHHTDPSIKTVSWHARMYKNWEQTKEILENEKVKILCRNCHNQERAKSYSNHETLIKSTNFNLNASTEEIKSFIRTSTPKAIKYPELQNGVLQIKKFTIINEMYEGKCVGCEKITTQNNLPALQFHHRDINDDKSMLWSKIQWHELRQIKKELIDKNCVSLCGNCHQMIHSTNFKTQYEEIIGSEHWKQVKTYINALERNVNNFKFKKDHEQGPVIKPKISLNKEKNGTKHPKKESMNFINSTPQKDVGEYLKIIHNKNPINLKVDINGDLKLEPKFNQKEIIRSMMVPKESNNNVKNLVHQKESNENIKSEKDPYNMNLDNISNRPKPLNIQELEKLQNAEYEYGEAWMKYLVHIAKLTQEKTVIRTKDISESVGVITRNVRKNLVKLAKKELIITSSEHNDRHVLLSVKGLEELNKIKDLKSTKK